MITHDLHHIKDCYDRSIKSILTFRIDHLNWPIWIVKIQFQSFGKICEILKLFPLIRHMTQYIICLDLDCFYAQVLFRKKILLQFKYCKVAAQACPEYKNHPIGVQQKHIIVTCNYPARNSKKLFCFVKELLFEELEEWENFNLSRTLWKRVQNCL